MPHICPRGNPVVSRLVRPPVITPRAAPCPRAVSAPLFPVTVHGVPALALAPLSTGNTEAGGSFEKHKTGHFLSVLDSLRGSQVTPSEAVVLTLTVSSKACPVFDTPCFIPGHSPSCSCSSLASLLLLKHARRTPASGPVRRCSFGLEGSFHRLPHGLFPHFLRVFTQSYPLREASPGHLIWIPASLYPAHLPARLLSPWHFSLEHTRTLVLSVCLAPQEWALSKVWDSCLASFTTVSPSPRRLPTVIQLGG